MAPRKKVRTKDIRLEKFLELQPAYRLDCTLTDAVVTRDRLRQSIWYNVMRSTFWNCLVDYVAQTKAHLLGETREDISIIRHRGTGAGVHLMRDIYPVYPQKDKREGIRLSLPIEIDIHDPDRNEDYYAERYSIVVPARIITGGNKRSIKSWLVAYMRKVQAKQREDTMNELRRLKRENPDVFSEVAKEKE